MCACLNDHTTFIRSRYQAKPATILIPIDFFFFPFRGGGALRYSVPKWLLSLIHVGSGCHCLRSFFLFNEKYMCHGIFILIRPNMFCVTLVGSVCVHILWEWRQQRNLKAVPKFVTSALVTKSRMRYMLFYIAEIGRFVSWGKTTPICSRHFSRTFRWFNVLCCFKSVIILFLISFPSRTLRFLSLYLILWIYLWLAGTSQQPISQTTWLKVTPNCN